MLPDFPVEKAKLSDLWLRYLEHRVNDHLGTFANMPYFSIHEGDRSRITREDGSTDEFNYQSIQSILSIRLDEVPHLTCEQTQEKINRVAQDIAQKMSKRFWTTLNHVTEQTGQVIDASGRQFCKDMLLQALRMVDLAFDSYGNPIMPTLVMHPHMFGQLKDEIATWKQDTELDAQIEQIVEQKRENWIACESRRKLID